MTDFKQPLSSAVLTHYFTRVVECLEENDLSSTGICGWIARICRMLAQYTGLALDDAGDSASGERYVTMSDWVAFTNTHTYMHTPRDTERKRETKSR